MPLESMILHSHSLLPNKHSKCLLDLGCIGINTLTAQGIIDVVLTQFSKVNCPKSYPEIVLITNVYMKHLIDHMRNL